MDADTLCLCVCKESRREEEKSGELESTQNTRCNAAVQANHSSFTAEARMGAPVGRRIAALSSSRPAGCRFDKLSFTLFCSIASIMADGEDACMSSKSDGWTTEHLQSLKIRHPCIGH